MRTPPASSRSDEIQTLRSIWRRQADYTRRHGAFGAPIEYLEAHFAMDITLERHLRVLDMFDSYVRGTVLEWGCHHALDSCVFRLHHGQTLELYGCDIYDERAYRPFHEFSGLRYTQLSHAYNLPYQDDQFDLITSNGVLEHVPDDERSLQELFRILKPGGTFVLTCLPNRYSYTEFLQRVRRALAHDRLYSMDQSTGMLLRHGFRVESSQYFFMLPTMLNGFPQKLKALYQRFHPVVWQANDVLEHMWPLNRLASNLCLIAVKPA